MNDNKLNSIKSRLKELESEKKKLLIDLAILQKEQGVDEVVHLPVCSNEWVRGVCDKPKIKCTYCPNQAFKQLNHESLWKHLIGKLTVGTYTIRSDDSCKFLATDFDGDNWEHLASARVLSYPG